MAYSAIVSKLTLSAHPNADKLELAHALGYTFVVGKDSYKSGDLVIVFPPDGQLSDVYCVANDLYPRIDEEGKRLNSGYIEPKHRRVKSQKFRGEKSEGLIMPLHSLDFISDLDKSLLVEGFMFTKIGDVPICNKYETEATKNRAVNRQNVVRKTMSVMFKKHFDTEQFRMFADKIPKGSLIIITEKLHGTSQRSMHAIKQETTYPKWVKRVPNFIERFLKLRTKLNRTEQFWTMMHGTRNTVMDKEGRPAYYASDAFRWRIADELPTLIKSEGIYYEVVGYQDHQTLIMPAVSTEPLKDKELTKLLGKEISYTYGCNPGQSEAYVYRCTVTNEEGYQWDLPWEHTKARAAELGLKTVPELTSPFFYDGNVERLRSVVEKLTEGLSTLDESHIREGVCIRVEHGTSVNIYKNKSFAFGVLEGYIKNNDSYVDTEESS